MGVCRRIIEAPMGYDVHIVRTEDWLDAAEEPIALEEVDAVVTADPELELVIKEPDVNE